MNTDWFVTERRPFTQEEKNAVKEACVVESQHGKSVQFSMVTGGFTFIPLCDECNIDTGCVINVNCAKIITISKGPEKIFRVYYESTPQKSCEDNKADETQKLLNSYKEQEPKPEQYGLTDFIIREYQDNTIDFIKKNDTEKASKFIFFATSIIAILYITIVGSEGGNSLDAYFGLFLIITIGIVCWLSYKKWKESMIKAQKFDTIERYLQEKRKWTDKYQKILYEYNQKKEKEHCCEHPIVTKYSDFGKEHEFLNILEAKIECKNDSIALQIKTIDNAIQKFPIHIHTKRKVDIFYNLTALQSVTKNGRFVDLSKVKVLRSYRDGILINERLEINESDLCKNNIYSNNEISF